MNYWIEIEDSKIVISGCEVELDIRVHGSFTPGSPMLRNFSGEPLEPPEPATFEVLCVECRENDKKDWIPMMPAALFPEHMTALIEQCLKYCQGE